MTAARRTAGGRLAPQRPRAKLKAQRLSDSTLLRRAGLRIGSRIGPKVVDRIDRGPGRVHAVLRCTKCGHESRVSLYGSTRDQGVSCQGCNAGRPLQSRNAQTRELDSITDEEREHRRAVIDAVLELWGPDDPAASWEDSKAARMAIAMLPGGLRFDEIGRLCGLSRDRAARIAREALAKMRALDIDWGRGQ